MAGMVAAIVGENPNIVKTRLFALCFGITFLITVFTGIQISGCIISHKVSGVRFQR
jgi:hypothetical protein